MNDFRSDIDPLALALSNENIENPSSAKPDSTKKRKADEISSSNYEDTNRELRELYELRRQRTGANKDLPTENRSTSPEKILLNFKAKENQTPVVEETKSGENLVKEYICEPLPARKLTPDICISKLKNYPDDCLTNNMMTFEKLVSEDLKGYSFGRRTTLQAAFMTTFGYSLDLIEPLLNQGVKIVLADDWKNINEPRIEKSFPEHPFFTLIRSPKDPTKNYQGTFHAKLMLLKFPTFLRVVVSSGNLTHDDWNILSNCLWFKDFPKIKSIQLSTSQNANPPSNEFDYDADFRTTLTSFVQSLMPTPQTVYSSLLGINIDDYHISGIDIILIPSIPGRHTGPDLEKYGHRKIGTVLRKLAAYSVKPKKQILTYQTSSLGNLEEKFLKEVMSSFVPSYMKVEDLNQKKKKGEPNPVIAEPASNRIKVIFPTKQYVETCNEGPQSAYCIVLNGKEYEKETFPKQIFYQFEAPEHYFFHEGVVPHLKVFLVTEENSEITDDSYMYLGSHNFSASAWGRYESGCSKISIYNTELGILIPPAKGSKQRKLDILNGLSFKFPPKKYASNQVPWTIKFGF